MIQTRYGRPVSRIVRVLEDTGDVEVVTDDGENRHYHLSSLVADGGIAEILSAAEKREVTQWAKT